MPWEARSTHLIDMLLSPLTVILLLNDLNSRIPVSIEQTASQAIITGYGKNEPKLEYLPENFNTENGKTVFTSGKDGIFPEGLPIGKVDKKNNDFFVKLFSDPNETFLSSELILFDPK